MNVSQLRIFLVHFYVSDIPLLFCQTLIMIKKKILHKWYSREEITWFNRPYIAWIRSRYSYVLTSSRSVLTRSIDSIHFHKNMIEGGTIDLLSQTFRRNIPDLVPKPMFFLIYLKVSYIGHFLDDVLSRTKNRQERDFFWFPRSPSMDSWCDGERPLEWCRYILSFCLDAIQMAIYKNSERDQYRIFVQERMVQTYRSILIRILSRRPYLSLRRRMRCPR